MARKKSINPFATLLAAGKVINARTDYLNKQWLIPSPEVSQELYRMWSEKVFAFHSAFAQMTFTSVELQQKLMSAAMQIPQASPSVNVKHAQKTMQTVHKGVEDVWQSAWHPIDKKVNANVKRLQVELL
ncbi:hypothetical protein [Halioxenophilus aromaticivorans]|uniref:Phasin domain-containing protein n=1 Tax=Halioxenophilus aromaticivorans TaxID=1306992 RepID=A0AAV3U588_9ALTE